MTDIELRVKALEAAFAGANNESVQQSEQRMLMAFDLYRWLKGERSCQQAEEARHG